MNPNLYISKSVAILNNTLQLSRPCHYHFSFLFSYNLFFTLNHFLNIYIFSNCSPSLPFLFSHSLYLNITLLLYLHLSLFCFFLFTPSYYKIAILSSILCIVFYHKKCYLSLSLS